MGGDSTIYVIYNPSIEDSASLNKFLTVVLDKAKFPIGKVSFKTEEEYTDLLKEGSKNYVICLNKTYTEVSIQTGQIISEQPFKFFSRYYQNDLKRIYILGLLNNLDELFDDKNEALKRTTWTKLKAFLTTYNETSGGMSSSVKTLPIKDSLSASTKEVKIETSQQKLSEAVVEEVIEQVVDTTPKEEKSSTSVKISYEELLEFYNLTSSIITDFDILMTLHKKIGDSL